METVTSKKEISGVVSEDFTAKDDSVKINPMDNLRGVVGKLMQGFSDNNQAAKAKRLPPKDYGQPRAKISEEAEIKLMQRKLEMDMNRVDRWVRNHGSEKAPRHLIEKANDLQMFQNRDRKPNKDE